MVEKNKNNNDTDIISLSSERMSLHETRNSFLPEQDAEEHSELRSLWRAVITQALMDAGSNSNKIEFKKEKARAISWLNGDSEDFHEVCIMADLDPEYVKQKAKEAIKRGCKWRKETNPFAKKVRENKNQANDVPLSFFKGATSSNINSLPPSFEVKSLFG